MKTEEYIKIKKIALLVSCATVLQTLEYLIPQPIPGIKLGLANIIVLVALVDLGFKISLEISVLRTIISSFILGTFFSPTFILSFSSAIISTLVMGLFYKLSTLNSKIYLSLIGISLIGAITSNLVQISLVYLLLIRHKGIFLLLPWLGISAIITGWITGFLASRVCQKLENSTNKITSIDNNLQNTFCQNIYVQNLQLDNNNIGHYLNENSLIHRASTYLKILIVFILTLIILLFNNFLVYTVILFLLFFIISLSKIPFLNLLSETKKITPFILTSFIIPTIFNKTGEIYLKLGLFNITRDGFFLGGMFVFRFVLMTISAFLLIKTTSPNELTNSLKKILVPFRIIGLSGDRMAEIITLSWSSIPILMENTRSFIKTQKFNSKFLKSFFPTLISLIVILYQQSDKEII
ncbi:MAG: hypothetical protein A2539_00075 [Elusimicrobia bacterium RIFOXYD2_FULL_34_15]|nr:MAG: hypothetical protein A2539_00075 [Elusimicrobia bacterium RIFOXYD2_FULL_34_15]